jgi:hypothetical protein
MKGSNRHGSSGAGIFLVHDALCLVMNPALTIAAAPASMLPKTTPPQNHHSVQ